MIVALTGLAGSGKDTAAVMIKEIFHNSITVALADTPKEMASKHFNLPIEYFYKRDLKDTPLVSTGKSPRDMLVSWFDELFEEHGDDYSLQMNIKKINTLLERYDCVIISDIRYPIEFAWLEENGITLLNIKRDVEKTIDHQTESDTDKGIIIDNNGTMEELKQTLWKFLADYV